MITTRSLNGISDYIKEDDDDGTLQLKLQTVCARLPLTSFAARRLRAFVARLILCIEKSRSFVATGVVLKCQDIRELEYHNDYYTQSSCSKARNYNFATVLVTYFYRRRVQIQIILLTWQGLC